MYLYNIWNTFKFVITYFFTVRRQRIEQSVLAQRWRRIKLRKTAVRAGCVFGDMVYTSRKGRSLAEEDEEEEEKEEAELYAGYG